MTAVHKYARLEATGLWRDGPDAQAREVLLTLGEATLVLADPRSQVPVDHWSLSAIVRRNPGRQPALFAPDTDPAAAVLEVEDPTMVEAIDMVRLAVQRRRGRRGRGRRAAFVGSFVAVLAAAALWLPGVVTDHAARVLPFVKRQEIGREMLGAMTRYTGAPCADPAGLAALARLTTRLFGSDGGQVVILRAGLPAEGTAHVPGGFLLADHRLVRDYDGPEVLAGHLLAERLRADDQDIMADVLRQAGLRATVGLLATGNLGREVLALQAQGRLQAAPAVVPADQLRARLAAAHVPLVVFPALVAAAAPPGDGAGGSSSPEILLPDADWRALQGICDR